MTSELHKESSKQDNRHAYQNQASRFNSAGFGASWRAILIGTVLIIPNMYWILDSVGQGYPTTISLYFNVIFCIFAITGVNFFVVHVAPKVAMQQGELLTIYVMLAIASSLAGHDVLRVLIPMIPYAFWYATPENDWADLFHRYIPDWMAVKNRTFLMEYYRGETTFYVWETMQGMVDDNTRLGGLPLRDGVPNGLY